MNRQWVVGKDGRLYHYVFFDPRRRELNGLSVYQFAEGAWRIDSRHLRLAGALPGQRVDGRNGWVRAFDKESRVKSYQAFQQQPWPSNRPSTS